MPAVSWSRTDQPLPGDRVMRSRGNTMLEIRKIQSGDAGEYTCRSTNSVNSSKPITIQLNVDGEGSLWNVFWDEHLFSNI